MTNEMAFKVFGIETSMILSTFAILYQLLHTDKETLNPQN